MLEIRASTRFKTVSLSQCRWFALMAKKAQVINGGGDCGRLSAGTEEYCIMCLLGSGIRIIHQNLGGHYVGLGGRRKHISGCCDPVSCPKPSLIGGRTKISSWSGGVQPPFIDAFIRTWWHAIWEDSCMDCTRGESSGPAPLQHPAGNPDATP